MALFLTYFLNILLRLISNLSLSGCPGQHSSKNRLCSQSQARQQSELFLSVFAARQGRRRWTRTGRWRTTMHCGRRWSASATSCVATSLRRSSPRTSVSAKCWTSRTRTRSSTPRCSRQKQTARVSKRDVMICKGKKLILLYMVKHYSWMGNYVHLLALNFRNKSLWGLYFFIQMLDFLAI